MFGLCMIQSPVPNHLINVRHSWNGPQVKSDIGWPFSQVLHQHYIFQGGKVCSSVGVDIFLPLACTLPFPPKRLKYRMKAPCRHQVDLAMFKEMCECCP